MDDLQFYVVEKKPPIAWVYLNRPEKKNAMNPPAWREAPIIFKDLDQDPEIRVIIVAGKGSCFSAGIDLMAMTNELPELMDPNQKGGTKWSLVHKIYELQETITCIEKCRKPVIAAVHGNCIGAGLDMITACDVRICSKDATFSLKEAAVAIVADVGVLQRIPHIVGQGHARELAYTARLIDAQRAKDILLVNDVYEDHEALMEAAEKLAVEMADNAPLAVMACKNVLNYGIGKSIEDGLKYVGLISTDIIPSDDLYEAVGAFAEKRKPKYTGK
ncbi:crotonase/enoyl-CoA hydratase family protein [Desulfatibacillum aliphaticivorans]|uniref:crotonase/enoyl-CoA hydratase family protein n=1 Tax=Desulfatibacillum aliphaticivorans TaxID=218208 RepID=UPI00040A0244|nr:crotonase/enoyl-CoA hydratase family protein [Desulfatibacillum aliphaticivorans]